MDLKKTPLVNEHERLGAKMAPFGGWLMPIQYSGIIDEHNRTRSEATLFDICHMGEFIINGDADKSGFNNIVTFDLNKIPVGSCRYGFALNEAGGIIDDLIVYRIACDRWMVVVNAATTEDDDAHFRKNLANGAGFKNVSAELGKLDLQGPKSLDVLKRLGLSGLEELAYYSFGHFDLLGEKVIISRTGYTGELGFEIYISNNRVAELWNALLKGGAVKPAGLGARDTLRLEMAYPLYGQDLSPEISPVEACKERFVDFDKDFIGKNALLGKKVSGGRRLINFTAKSRRAPRHNYRIFSGGRDIGVVTSGSFSPSLSVGIGMGYVDKPCRAGTDIILKENNVEIEATITTGPFYKKGTAKISEGSHASA